MSYFGWVGHFWGVGGGDCGCTGHYFGRVGVGGKIFWLGGGGLR